MKLTAACHRFLVRANVPAALLVALLQRTPLLRVFGTAEETVIDSPAGSVLRSAVAAAASLGAVHALAGATTIVSSTPSPLGATVGQPIPTVAFGINGNQLTAGSWQVQSTIPPGLNFQGLTGPGNINTANPVLGGTPTVAGVYQIVLEAWEDPNETGPESPLFSYTVDVAAPPVSFTVQPASQTIGSGNTIVFDAVAVATGGAAPTYQWRFNSAPISGATDPILEIPGVTPANAGSYTCIATASGYSATSSAASLTVVSTSTPGALTNISSRANVGTGNNILIGGFVVGGSTARAVLIRAIGPGLHSVSGLDGVLPNPQLTIYSGNTPIYANTGWGGDATITQAMIQVGAFPLQAGSADSVLLVTLPPGGYTAQVQDVNGNSGLALVEVYQMP
jgi:hypothetical protein